MHGEQGRKTDGNVRSGQIGLKRRSSVIPQKKFANLIKIFANENIERTPKRKLDFGDIGMGCSVEKTNARKDELETCSTEDSDEEQTSEDGVSEVTRREVHRGPTGENVVTDSAVHEK